MQIWLLLFGFAYICGVRCEGDIHWLYSMTVSHEFAYMRCIIFRITSVKLKRAVSRDDSVSFYPCALWKRASIVTLLTASAELAWDLHGEFQRLHNSSYQAEVFLCWPEIFLLKHQYHSCSLNFQSSTPYVYSIFAGLQVFRETDCIPFTVFLTYKVGQRRQNASISWTEFHATLILLYVFLLTDIDECAQDQHLCSQGRCENTEGSFLCICPAGFMASEEGTNCIGNSSVLSDAKIP